MSSRPIHLTHIITGLDTGGAEMMLYKLLRAGSGTTEPWVVSLMDDGTLGSRIRELGVPLTTLNLRAGRPTLRAARQLRRHFSQVGPAVVQGWMYHGNLAAVVAMLGNGPRCPMVWNITHTLYDIKHERRLTRCVIRLNAMLSGRPAAIVFDSHTSLRQHVAFGFDSERSRVIPNGFELDRFRPDPDILERVRRELGFDSSTVLIGLIARFHPMKDHATFLRAAARLVPRSPKARFVLAGRGVEPGNKELASEIDRLHLWQHVKLLGEHPDTAQLLPALDVACLSSAWGDAFPNIVGEAMACGVPCVVTNVGDSAMIVGDTGRVVPPRDPDALAGALETLLAMEGASRRSLGLAARERVRTHFAMPNIVHQYDALYAEMNQYVRH